jgi:hypothetical protein
MLRPATRDRENFAIGGGQFQGTDMGTREGFSKYEGARGKAREKGTTINNLFNEDPTLEKNILKEYEKGSGADRIIRDLNLKDKISPRALQDYINEQLNTGKFKIRKANKAPDVVKQPGEESKKFMDYIENIIDQNPGKKNMFQNLEASDVIKNSGADINTANATRILSKIYNLATKGAKLEKFYPNIEKRAIELIDTGMGTPDITNTLINEGLIERQVEKNNKTSYRATKNYFQRLIDDKKTKVKKLTKQPGDIVDVVKRNNRDVVIKNILDQQTEPITSNRIATIVSKELGDNVSSEYVQTFFKRNNIDIDKYVKSTNQRVFPEVQTLDKIVKKNIKYLTDPNITFVDKSEFLTNEYTKTIGKNKAKTVTANETGTRLKKLLSIYAGAEQRAGADLYKKIKPLNNYTDPDIQKNLIGLTTNLSRSSNVDIAKMLGLPKKDIQLLQDLQKATSQLGDFKLAGDHTDIKAIMSDFPNYKKNFMRIQYISNDLNTLKSTYDKKIIALYKAAKAGAAPETIIPKLEEIQNDFKTKTGYDIGGFSFKKNGKIAIDPQTVSINEYRYPINDNVIKTMGNIEAYENKKYKNPFDKEVISAQGSPNKLKAIYEKYKGNVKVIDNSKYVKALDNVPKLKGFKDALLYGGAGVATIFATAANADTTNEFSQRLFPGIKPEGSPGQINPETKEGFSTGEKLAGAGAAAGTAYKFGKPLLKTAAKVLRPLGFPSVAAGFAAGELLSDDPNLGVAGAELLAPELIKKGASTGTGIMSKIGRFAANPFFKGARAFTPVGLGLMGIEGVRMGMREQDRINQMRETDPEAYQEYLDDQESLLDFSA